MATWNLNCSCKARQQQEQNKRNFLRMGLKHTCIDSTVVSTDRWFQEQVVLRCQFENTLAMITNLKSVVRTPDPVQQIIKIRRKPPIPSCPWIFRHHWQVTELQQAKSLVTTYAATTHPVQAIKSRHCSLNFESPAVQSLKKKFGRAARRPRPNLFWENICN